jgi:polyisoprenyl-teichoic acid--peptidoglycan teichoic acid transferase
MPGVYGIDCSIKTMEAIYGVDINYYVRINFSTVISLVETIGYIEVDNPVAFTDKGYDFHLGKLRLNAPMTLLYARQRHAFEDSDIQRGANQQQVIKGVINRLTEPMMITKIESIISVVSRLVDTNVSGEDLMALIRKQIQSNKDWDRKFIYDYRNRRYEGHVQHGV